MESLEAELDISDFAVAIAQPDDLTVSRGASQPSPRDNIIFELGMFIGRIGRRRSFLLQPMEVGLTSDAGTLEAWPLELSFECKVIPERLAVSEAQFTAAVQKAEVWNELLSRFPQLEAIADAAVAAPKLGSVGQSLLHIWSGLEALFPTVSTEVSFRIALYIAQLAGSSNRLSTYESVRGAYGIRSKVAHGARSAVTTEDWNQAWGIMMESLNALVRRKDLPTEQALMHELLA